MPMIVGAPRSGTTLLRLMLDAHPDLAIPPETGFLILSPRFTQEGPALRQAFAQAVTHFPVDAPGWADFGIAEDAFRDRLAGLAPFTVSEGYRTFYRMYAERFGKTRWGDKTPAYALHMDSIETVLPEARFIHIIRDGRDVALSLRQMWFSPGRTPEELAAHWCHYIQTARRLGADRRHYLEVRYEELVRDPEATLRAVCAHIALDYHPSMTGYHRHAAHRLAEHGTRVKADGGVLVTREQRQQNMRKTIEPPDDGRIHAWRQAMTDAEHRRFVAVAGRLLAALGYPLD